MLRSQLLNNFCSFSRYSPFGCLGVKVVPAEAVFQCISWCEARSILRTICGKCNESWHQKGGVRQMRTSICKDSDAAPYDAPS